MKNSARFRQPRKFLIAGALTFMVAVVLVMFGVQDMVIGAIGLVAFALIAVSIIMFATTLIKMFLFNKGSEEVKEPAIEKVAAPAEVETSKTCKYCGSENKLEEVKCANCGANLKRK